MQSKVTLTFQKYFEITRKKGDRAPLRLSPKSAYEILSHISRVSSIDQQGPPRHRPKNNGLKPTDNFYVYVK